MHGLRMSLFTLAALGLASSAALAQPMPNPGPPAGPGPGYSQGFGPGPGPAQGYRHGLHYHHHMHHFPPPGGWRAGHRYPGPFRPIPNYRYYHLRPPPPGYGWVNGGNQFLLIALSTGMIASVVYLQTH